MISGKNLIDEPFYIAIEDAKKFKDLKLAKIIGDEMWKETKDHWTGYSVQKMKEIDQITRALNTRINYLEKSEALHDAIARRRIAEEATLRGSQNER